MFSAVRTALLRALVWASTEIGMAVTHQMDSEMETSVLYSIF
jgi:hypothetical protein